MIDNAVVKVQYPPKNNPQGVEQPGQMLRPSSRQRQMQNIQVTQTSKKISTLVKGKNQQLNIQRAQGAQSALDHFPSQQMNAIQI